MGVEHAVLVIFALVTPTKCNLFLTLIPKKNLRRFQVYLYLLREQSFSSTALNQLCEKVMVSGKRSWRSCKDCQSIIQNTRLLYNL